MKQGLGPAQRRHGRWYDQDELHDDTIRLGCQCVPNGTKDSTKFSRHKNLVQRALIGVIHTRLMKHFGVFRGTVPTGNLIVRLYLSRSYPSFINRHAGDGRSWFHKSWERLWLSGTSGVSMEGLSQPPTPRSERPVEDSEQGYCMAIVSHSHGTRPRSPSASNQ